MAGPISTTALVEKVAAAVLTNERLRKGRAWTIGRLLSPVILIPMLICSLLSGTADHNAMVIDVCFNGGVISGHVSEGYRGYREDMRDSFRRLDGTIASVNNEMEDGDSLDSIRVKAIFYALFFGTESPSRVEHRQFVENFIIYEELTRTATTTDADGNGTIEEEIYMVAIPIKDVDRGL